MRIKKYRCLITYIRKLENTIGTSNVPNNKPKKDVNVARLLFKHIPNVWIEKVFKVAPYTF